LPAIIALSCCLCAVFLALFPVHLVDDAYISFRAAGNLAAGHGLVFNPGERLEAWTNLLWVMVLVPAACLTQVDTLAPHFGAVFAVLALVETYRACRYCGVPSRPAVAAIVVLGITPSYWLSATNGLEGGLFAFLLARTLSAFMKPARPAMTGLWGGLMFLTRPESGAFLPVFLAFELYRQRSSALSGLPAPRRGFGAILLVWGGIMAVATGFRLVYYGQAVPNSVVAKYIPLSAEIYGHWAALYLAKLAVEYFGAFAIRLPHLALAPFAALVLDRRNSGVQLSVTVLSVALLAVGRNGGDWMPDHRLIMCYLPLIGVCTAASLAAIAVRCARQSAAPGEPALVSVAGVAVACFIVLLSVPAENRIQSRPDPIAQGELQWGRIARAIRPVLVDQDVLAPEALGRFAYLLPASRMHDFQGLADRHIACRGSRFHPRFGKSDYGYSVGISPTLFVFQAAEYHVPLMQADSNGEFGRRYRGFRLHGLDRDFHVFIRRDHVERIRPSLDRFDARPAALSTLVFR